MSILTLNDTHPELLKEWNYNKNDILPSTITYGSKRKIHWICSKGHEWIASLNSRTNKSRRTPTGCPICSNKKILNGYNDLATTHPYLIDEWDFSCNFLLPSEVSFGSKKKVSWKCIHGHSWITSIEKRTNGQECPICSNKKVLINFNDLNTTHPQLIKEWDFEKNTILPTSITYGSNIRVYWKCEKNHRWIATVKNRTSQLVSSNCPYCSMKRKI
ncbi:zinc-ribbon domain-containing protein [Erysipelothrix aquatica]|uniref:zinc-ribbon domain-containing protein n=1 Tax=Erysipelothrix aquatica TaxID=2683714 RepID=UPI001356F834